MSNTSSDSDKKKGFFINSKGVSCILCRCKRQSYRKETKTVKENNVVTTNIIEDRHNMKFGAIKKDIERLEIELNVLKFKIDKKIV